MPTVKVAQQQTRHQERTWSVSELPTISYNIQTGQALVRSGYCRVKYVTSHTRPGCLLFSSGKGRAFSGLSSLSKGSSMHQCFGKITQSGLWRKEEPSCCCYNRGLENGISLSQGRRGRAEGWVGILAHLPLVRKGFLSLLLCRHKKEEG